MTASSRQFTVLILFAFGLMLPGLSLANAGKILFARGEVAIVDDAGNRETAAAGTVIEEGDRIRTGDDSRAQVRLSDGALISLRSHSDYQIVAQKQEEGLLEQAGKLFSGWMRSVSGAIARARPDKVSQETPVATIGIRGTTYQVIHMPEGGIPGMPESEPGTYIYLQQGRIESVAGGETRFMEPGDVVFVPVDGSVPLPAPDKKSLFSQGEGRAVQTESGALLETPGGETEEDREDLESTDSLNDGLDDDIENSASLDGAGARGIYGNNFQPMYSRGNDLELASGEDGVFVTRMSSADTDGVVHELTATEEEPDSRGSAALANGQQVIWGVWSQGNYNATFDGNPVTTSGDWHYAAGSNMLDYTQAINVGLTGQYGYDFVGGTELSGSAGGSRQIDPQNTGLLVDFSANTISVNFATDVESYSGSGSFAEFYRGPDEAGTTVNLTGTNGGGEIRGSFVGPNAEGAVTNVQVDEGSAETFYGTAAFERAGQL